MVFCPKCGKSNPDNNINCIKCGEVLQEETRFLKIVKIFNSLGFIFALLMLIFLFGIYFDWIPVEYYLWFFVVLILALIFLSKRVKRFLQTLTIKLLFGGLEKRECPNCEEFVSNENYCFNCGYNLANVIGYYQIGSYQPLFMEINKKYIRVFKSMRDRYFSLSRLDSIKFYNNEIKNPEVDWCTGKVLTNPCIKFNYQGEKVVFSINKSILNGLSQIFNNITGPQEIGGYFNWLRNQSIKRFGIVTAILLVLIISPAVYFTYTTPITYAGSSSDIPGLEVVNATGYKHIYAPNSVTVEGFVKNNGNQTKEFIKVRIIGYDSAGTEVSVEETYIDAYRLGPGESSHFYDYPDDYGQTIRSFKVKVFE
ncbi:MAG: FxLYD domain-containing protein [Methanomicrobiales archaeon]